jgi:hypothetical protein
MWLPQKAGASCKVHNTKAKDKENLGVRPTKCPHEITADDADVRAKCRCPSGSNNYTTADTNKYVSEVK